MDFVEWFFQDYGEVQVLDRPPDFEEHVRERKHSVSFLEVLEVHSDYLRTEYFYNEGHLEGEPDRDAPILMLGYTQAGRFLCVPITPADTRGHWLALTAYEPDSPALEEMYKDYVEG
jgi:hypothetical protein